MPNHHTCFFTSLCESFISPRPSAQCEGRVELLMCLAFYDVNVEVWTPRKKLCFCRAVYCRLRRESDLVIAIYFDRRLIGSRRTAHNSFPASRANRPNPGPLIKLQYLYPPERDIAVGTHHAFLRHRRLFTIGHTAWNERVTAFTYFISETAW